MKILYVSPKDTPAKGWGAVQKIIWERKMWLEAQGHQCDIFRVRSWSTRHAWLAGTIAAPWNYDVVHVECDWVIPKWIALQNWYRFPMIVSTHYGYAAFPEKWQMKYYARGLDGLQRASHVLLQSREIEAALCANGVGQRQDSERYILPNAIKCNNIRFASEATLPGGVCLGRIEPRKRQADLVRMLAGTGVSFDFVGPMSKEQEAEGGFTPSESDPLLRFLGSWSVEQVNDSLTSYRAYVLISDGETQVPLATMEAMAAGLSVVTTANAAHLLPEELPFVYRIDPDADDVAAVVRRAVEENAGHREAIRRYALEHFDWDVIAPRYVEILKDVIATTPKK